MKQIFNTPTHWIDEPVRVLVVGAGGTGSALLSLLAQMDYNLRQLSQDSSYLDLTVCDGDEVSEFNIGRQAFFSADIGMNKAEVLVKRFNQFTSTNWSYSTDYLTPTSLEGYINQFDLVITCVDSASFRFNLGSHFNDIKTKALWLDCGNCEHSGQIILGHLGKVTNNKIPNLFDLYGTILESMEDRPEDSCSHESSLSKQDFGVNHTIAIHANNLLWRLMRHGSSDHHGMFINLTCGEVSPLAVDLNVWATFGYAPNVQH